MSAIHEPTVVVGIGEMGSVFARALLRAGHPVFPVVRGIDPGTVAEIAPRPAVALVAVGEDDLDPVLAALPASWRDRVALIQNELLPRDWQRHGITSPTVAPVWFEKKPGQDVKVIVPTPVAGPGAPLIIDALGGIGIAAEHVPDDEIVGHLVAKNLYILTANIAGLVTGGTVGPLWHEHRDVSGPVSEEVLTIQQTLVGTPIDRDAALTEMVRAIDADPDHKATGRSAPRRLARALDHADAAGLDVPTLRSIARTHPA